MDEYSEFEKESFAIAENFHKLGKYKDSISVCKELIESNPANSEILNLVGINLIKLKSTKEAINYFIKALKYSPNNIQYIMNLSSAFYLSGNVPKAIEILSQFANQSSGILAFFDLAKYYSFNNEHTKAIDLYKALCVINPNNIQVLFTLAEEYIKNFDAKHSLELLEKAYNLGCQEAGIKLLNQYVKLNMPQQAITFAKNYYFERTADFYFIYAKALDLNGNINDANTCFQTAIGINKKPYYTFGYAGFLLKHRYYKEGFKYYETRRNINGFSPNIKKVYKNTTDLQGKTILVYYEQNLIETILFSRFLPSLQKIAEQVYFYSQKELYGLFDVQCVSDINIDYDVAIPLPSLPYILGVSKDTDLDIRAPFLFDKQSSFLYKKVVNIAFAFGNLAKMRHDRIKLERILDVLTGININLISLQIGGISNIYTKNHNIIDRGKNMKSYSDVMKNISDIDLFVGNDTEYFHLLANTGIHCLLFRDTQRWIWEDAKQTNWYKNLIIFNPDENLKWDGAIRTAFKYIKKYVSKN